ncbi:putative mitochondrial protein [Phytophthora megakarya]|uniref:Putative mitochondrial protein n=1 Tax=Phytophthora megakarya TaxID=4795 RepID=A0A225W5K7_9STRA|nr:putative mitochondrial protein [Phytophthora megakarya]
MKCKNGFTVFCNGQLITAKSWKQEILAESTCACEAELIAANTRAHDAVWLEQLVDELKIPRTSTILYCGSSSARELTQHAGKHRRTKQLRIKDLKIHEYVAVNGLIVNAMATKDNVADTLTKPLSVEHFRHHQASLGIQELGMAVKGKPDKRGREAE